jgi:hypothetical protein
VKNTTELLEIANSLNKEEIQKIGIKVNKFISNYSWDNIVDSFESLLE